MPKLPFVSLFQKLHNPFGRWAKGFLVWYDRHQELNTGITAALFATQVLHLFWLATHVLSQRITGEALFTPGDTFQTWIIIFDYFEIPALLSATLLYGRKLAKDTRNNVALRNLVFVNVQYLHIFWITDEFVEAVVTGAPQATILPAWLALIAIIIDYLEVPVMYATFQDAYHLYRRRVSKTKT